MLNSIPMQFLTKPLTTGAIWPSSPDLAKMLVGKLGLEKAEVAVELGPGTGAVTGEILHLLPTRAKFFTVELNKSIIPVFKEKYPATTVYNDSAANLPVLLQKEGCGKVDVVISGLPWASFSDALQEEILDGVTSVMPEGAAFATFAYLQGMILPAGRKFRKRLSQYFRSVEKTKVVWKNLPPAFCYHCRR